MKASDLVAELEARFRCQQGPHTAFVTTVSGREFYEMIGVEANPYELGLLNEKPRPGIIRNGVTARVYQTEDEACAATMASFNAYEADWRYSHKGRNPFLVWRYDSPHAFWFSDDDGIEGHGRVKLRLTLCNEETVDISDTEYDKIRTLELGQKIGL